MPKEIPEILRYFLEDLLDGESGYNHRSMFGGYGLYKGGKIFAILVDEEFYFKTGENNIKDYTDIGAKPFSYTIRGKIHTMSYYKIPEDILEDRWKLKIWIQKSLQVPLKAQKKPLKTNELSQKVLEYLLTIPTGKVTTYKILAHIFEVHPRTIASIMKYNKEPSIYPCYKVIASDGKLSGYNSVRGVQEKIEKLEKDHIKIIDGKIDTKYFYHDEQK